MNIQLASKIDCTGCMACQGACKHNAIRIEKDDNGFVYPLIDKSICKQCGACMQKCPILNYDKLKFRAPQKCYAAKIKNEDLTKGCTSGGIATGMASQVLQKGGVVYGASYVPSKGVQHIRIDHEAQIGLLKGSKYVESYITGETYRLIKADKNSGKEILFIGTPCQVAAVERVCGKEGISTISFICGGVPSQDYLFSHLESYGLKKNEVSNVIFRKGRLYCIEAWKGSQVAFYQEENDNIYLSAFDRKGYVVRPSCLRCEFCRNDRVGTFTIGDFWGIELADCKIKNENNLSCIITHDEVGQNQMKSLDNVLLDEVSFEDVGRGNICLHNPRRRKGWQIFEKLMHHFYPLVGFNRSVKMVEVVGKVYRAPHTFLNILKQCLS